MLMIVYILAKNEFPFLPKYHTKYHTNCTNSSHFPKLQPRRMGVLNWLKLLYDIQNTISLPCHLCVAKSKYAWLQSHLHLLEVKYRRLCSQAYLLLAMQKGKSMLTFTKTKSKRVLCSFFFGISQNTLRSILHT